MNLSDLNEKFTDRVPAETSLASPGNIEDWGKSKPIPWNANDATTLNGKLKERGWEVIGIGMGARVYKNPSYPNWVMKAFTPKDRGYMRFYSMAKRSENPHFPEVGRMGYLDFEETDDYPRRVFVVMIEQLTPIEKNPMTGQPTGDKLYVVQFLDKYTDGYCDEDGKLTDNGRGSISAGEDAIRNVEYACTRGSVVFNLFPHLQEACDMVKNVIDSKKKYYQDVHQGNIMWRGTMPVFTDVIVAWERA